MPTPETRFTATPRVRAFRTRERAAPVAGRSMQFVEVTGDERPLTRIALTSLVSMAVAASVLFFNAPRG
jgi:hypothetical protein